MHGSYLETVILSKIHQFNFEIHGITGSNQTQIIYDHKNRTNINEISLLWKRMSGKINHYEIMINHGATNNTAGNNDHANANPPPKSMKINNDTHKSNENKEKIKCTPIVNSQVTMKSQIIPREPCVRVMIKATKKQRHMGKKTTTDNQSQQIQNSTKSAKPSGKQKTEDKTTKIDTEIISQDKYNKITPQKTPSSKKRPSMTPIRDVMMNDEENKELRYRGEINIKKPRLSIDNLTQGNYINSDDEYTECKRKNQPRIKKSMVSIDFFFQKLATTIITIS